MKLFFLSRENISLAKAEVEALIGKGTLYDNILLVNSNKKTNRLAYTRFILNLIFECKDDKIETKIKEINWNKHVKGSFAMSFMSNGETSQDLSRKYGGIIYDLLENPKVDLENPRTSIITIQNLGRTYLGILEWENNEDFNSRSAKNRPGNLPITLNPKLARACVNLTGSNNSIYDPFCGTGGFLIEAGLMNLNAIGSDIDKNMLEQSKLNLKYFKVKKYKLLHKDALEISNKYDYIVTDMPYGRSSRKVGDDIYNEFISKLKKILKKRAVIVLSDRVKIENAIKKNKLKLINKFSVYVHKSLTRKVYVIEN